MSALDNVNPNWYDIFTEDAERGEPIAKILDDLSELSCGTASGKAAADVVQSYARHVRVCLEAAFRLGRFVEATVEEVEV